MSVPAVEEANKGIEEFRETSLDGQAQGHLFGFSKGVFGNLKHGFTNIIENTVSTCILVRSEIKLTLVSE